MHLLLRSKHIAPKPRIARAPELVWQKAKASRNQDHKEVFKYQARAIIRQRASSLRGQYISTRSSMLKEFHYLLNLHFVCSRLG
jgi:hypothetical protein